MWHLKLAFAVLLVGSALGTRVVAQTSHTESRDPDVSPPTAVAATPVNVGAVALPGIVASPASPEYVLRSGDVVQVKVYQEDDLTALSRIGKEGTINMPLLGPVKVGGRSLEAAARAIREALAEDYLVNPQVTINVTEFAKRRFTVLGQVQRPGTYDMPPDESISLLQAIASAGGYTRIGNARKISVQRTTGNDSKVFKLDAQAMASSNAEKPFEILPDDVIIVGERWI